MPSRIPGPPGGTIRDDLAWAVVTPMIVPGPLTSRWRENQDLAYFSRRGYSSGDPPDTPVRPPEREPHAPPPCAGFTLGPIDRDGTDRRDPGAGRLQDRDLGQWPQLQRKRQCRWQFRQQFEHGRRRGAVRPVRGRVTDHRAERRFLGRLQPDRPR